ncbi:hypothetical protein [Actinomarinicola tropica]|uniref:Uncharacterized protein n=1 Tax=Actinomarinicola tropica TaxID=2789776 RepID=A0A5Q2RPE8_9ACTN|nr:hypothetical protein [Actinomarinicola tropica]QGG96461.1 hypothetical protein GH723_15880 [Actinomarinicola tropica]
MDKSALRTAGSTDRPDWQESRLAELVLHLTGCSPEDAQSAVADPAPHGRLSNDEALERVARAIVRLRH